MSKSLHMTPEEYAEATVIDPYDQDGSTYVYCVDPHLIGDKVTLSCSICEAPIDAVLIRKDNSLASFANALSNVHANTYKIVFQSCDCPVVVFQLPDGLC